MRQGEWLGWLLTVSLSAGCGGVAGPARFPAEKIPVPDDSQIYMAEARPDGVTGGPGGDKVEAELFELLRQRTEKPLADGALGGTACWALREIHDGRRVDMIASDFASRHFGFGGVLVATGVFDMSAGDSWHELVKTLPNNVPLTRYGICVSPAGRSAAVVLGNMEASYGSIQRVFDPGQSVTLKGEIATRFKNAMVFLTKPDGKVDHKNLPGRSFDETFLFTEPGSYRLEVMADGAQGPAIVINLPLYVGVPEPIARGGSAEVVDPDVAEPRLLELLNQSRAKAGARPLRSDTELLEIARSHSEDLADHHFFAHVSPSTGTPEDRARRAKVLVSNFGENIGIGATPEDVHEGLMNSPGHRMNMLLPDYTHVGIAAEKGDGSLVVTMNFARRPDPASVPTSSAQVEAWVRDLRSQRGLKPYEPDPVYRGGAQSGADTLASGAEPKEVGEAVEAGLVREVNRLRSSRPSACILHLELLELAQLATIPALLSPDLGRLGVGTRVHEDGKGKRLSTVLVLDGATCGP
jgi:hypothetical protein